ncbi:hypothetical protein BVRB_4g076480 [Beta vulgaris subsp. vulgaris]|uniref:Uncharacterized protein n=1 Tax=Beta vulgaris subsp. vulgaris TaxID=3555 RepID=A0A0J8CKM2_BETVV|nr:hypothetical protein BVRB_4g076480 [Beta vulgaris subsp. vulgaris]
MVVVGVAVALLVVHHQMKMGIRLEMIFEWQDHQSFQARYVSHKHYAVINQLVSAKSHGVTQSQVTMEHGESDFDKKNSYGFIIH